MAFVGVARHESRHRAVLPVLVQRESVVRLDCWQCGQCVSVAAAGAAVQASSTAVARCGRNCCPIAPTFGVMHSIFGHVRMAARHGNETSGVARSVLRYPFHDDR